MSMIIEQARAHTPGWYMHAWSAFELAQRSPASAAPRALSRRSCSAPSSHRGPRRPRAPRAARAGRSRALAGGRARVTPLRRPRAPSGRRGLHRPRACAGRDAGEGAPARAALHRLQEGGRVPGELPGREEISRVVTVGQRHVTSVGWRRAAHASPALRARRCMRCAPRAPDRDRVPAARSLCAGGGAECGRRGGWCCGAVAGAPWHEVGEPRTFVLPGRVCFPAESACCSEPLAGFTGLIPGGGAASHVCCMHCAAFGHPKAVRAGAPLPRLLGLAAGIQHAWVRLIGTQTIQRTLRHASAVPHR